MQDLSPGKPGIQPVARHVVVDSCNVLEWQMDLAWIRSVTNEFDFFAKLELLIALVQNNVQVR
jgi:hypothetical protein